MNCHHEQGLQLTFEQIHPARITSPSIRDRSVRLRNRATRSRFCQLDNQTERHGAKYPNCPAIRKRFTHMSFTCPRRFGRPVRIFGKSPSSIQSCFTTFHPTGQQRHPGEGTEPQRVALSSTGPWLFPRPLRIVETASVDPGSRCTTWPFHASIGSTEPRSRSDVPARGPWQPCGGPAETGGEVWWRAVETTPQARVQGRLTGDLQTLRTREETWSSHSRWC